MTRAPFTNRRGVASNAVPGGRVSAASPRNPSQAA